MAGELLKAATGMLVLRGERGRPALLGLLVKETHVVHDGPESADSLKVPRKSRTMRKSPACFYFRRRGRAPVFE